MCSSNKKVTKTSINANVRYSKLSLYITLFSLDEEAEEVKQSSSKRENAIKQIYLNNI